MVREFYANYLVILKNMTPSVKDKDIRKLPHLDMIRVQGNKINIYIKSISKALFGEIFLVSGGDSGIGFPNR